MTSETPLRLEFTMHFERKPHGKKKLVTGETPIFVGHVPRVARLLALAHHFDHLIEQGVVQDYAEIARLAQLSRARVAQIMALKFLAPDIQERIALLPQSHGKDLVSEKQLRRIAMMPEWGRQQVVFGRFLLPVY
jgi:hypothetical protein